MEKDGTEGAGRERMGSRVGERGGKGWSLGMGFPLQESGEGAVPPPNFFEFLSRNGAFLCILLITGAMTPPLWIRPWREGRIGKD